jgi:hypothetical protein
MSTPAIPQREPQDSKDSKGNIMRESLITTLKKGYEAAKNPTKNRKPKRASLIRDDFFNADNPLQTLQHSNNF